MSFPSGFSEPACVGLAEFIYLGLIKWQATLNLTNFFQRASTWPRTSGMLYPEEAPFTSSLPQSSPTLISPCNHPLPWLLQKQQAALCTSQASTWQAPGIAPESHCTGWGGDPRPHETKQFPPSEYPQNMTLNSPGTSLDKRRISAGPAGKEGGNRGGGAGGMQDGGKRRGGKEKEKEKEEMLMKTSNRKGQFCPPSYTTVNENKECIFPSSSSL